MTGFMTYRRFHEILKILNDFNTCLAPSNSIKILTETKFYREADLILKIVFVNQISIKEEIRLFYE